jgi:hypothetical protein
MKSIGQHVRISQRVSVFDLLLSTVSSAPVQFILTQSGFRQSLGGYLYSKLELEFLLRDCRVTSILITRFVRGQKQDRDVYLRQPVPKICVI